MAEEIFDHCKQGNIAEMDRLLKNTESLDINIIALHNRYCPPFGMNLLTYACYLNSNLDMIEYLVEKGIDINHSSPDGYGALHRAIYNDRLDIVKYLVQKGADINIRTYRGLTLLDTTNNLDIIKFLIENGINVNGVDMEGDTTLHHVYDVDKLEYLLKNTMIIVDINRQNIFGETPLHYASRQENTDIVIVLLRHGAYKNIPDKSGRYPLDVAKNEDIINILNNWSVTKAS